MTQFEGTFGDELTQPARTSGLAIGSLVCSLICCIPVTTILGILLGIGALVSIGGNPARKGKGLALSGILLGVLFTVGQGVIYPKAFAMGKAWWELVNRGPTNALSAGFAGDVVGFKAAFHGPGATASDAEVQAFIDELRRRYGEFQGGHLAQQQPQQTMGQPQLPFSYVLQFENAQVEAEAEIIFGDPPDHEGFINKIGSVTIFDEDLGDLTYPPSGDADAAPSDPAPTTAPAEIPEPSGEGDGG